MGPPPVGAHLRANERNRIVVGVLIKFVNFGKGWRHRLFVLQSGVLRYYKIFGPTKVDANRLFDHLRKQGEVVTIGTETAIVERKCERPAASRMEPQGEIHLQVSKLQESTADYRKFYIDTGTSRMRLRAETKEDRWAWLQALSQAKGAWEDMPPDVASCLTTQQHEDKRMVIGDNAFLGELEGVRARLVERGASAAVVEYVQDLLLAAHQRLHGALGAEADKRATLLALVRQLEDDKRQLETRVVADIKLQNKTAASRGSVEAPEASESDLQSDAERDVDEPGGDRGGAASDSESDAEVFYDADAAEDGGGSRPRAGPKPDCRPLAPLPATAAAPAQAIGRDAAVPDWLAAELPPPARRERLPTPVEREKQLSLWSIIKECVGKDLTRVCLPVFFNEPLSALQKTAEDLEYSELIDEAAELPAGSWERLIKVGAFAVSCYSSAAPHRTSKPFNPLLGETYELVHAEKGVRFLAEKVVHHPTVIAACCEGRRWHFEGDGEVRSKFWGRSIELHPTGVCCLTFHDGDQYTWSKVTTSINNLIIGKLYIDHGGLMRVHNARSGLTCKLRFREHGLLKLRGEKAHEVRGTVETAAGERLERPVLFGKWDEAMWAELPNGQTHLLWRSNPPPPDPTRYQLTQWAIQLNEITPGLEAKLAPTDCRLRPDQHALEQGLYDLANAEKQRLEKKQRAARKAADRGDPIRPRWFTAVPGTAQGEALCFRYNGEYWQCREAGDWEGVRDIFSSAGPAEDSPSLPATPVAAGAGSNTPSPQGLPLHESPGPRPALPRPSPLAT